LARGWWEWLNWSVADTTANKKDVALLKATTYRCVGFLEVWLGKILFFISFLTRLGLFRLRRDYSGNLIAGKSN